MIYKKVSEQIREVRKARGISQEQLAELSHLSTQHISFIEQDRRKPQLKTLFKIATALGVRVKDLIPF